jgi:hypothetical protein
LENLRNIRDKKNPPIMSLATFAGTRSRVKADLEDPGTSKSKGLLPQVLAMIETLEAHGDTPLPALDGTPPCVLRTQKIYQTP